MFYRGRLLEKDPLLVLCLLLYISNLRKLWQLYYKQEDHTLVIIAGVALITRCKTTAKKNTNLEMCLKNLNKILQIGNQIIPMFDIRRMN